MFEQFAEGIMGHAFVDFAFTPAVKAVQNAVWNASVQSASGGRERTTRHTYRDRNRIHRHREMAFIKPPWSGSGWPYVQFRGGPPGFLRVIDNKTVGYADFRGNVQYLTIGNLEGEERIALILMDYANQRRLKIWGRARVVHATDDPERVNALAVPNYRARIERAVVITRRGVRLELYPAHHATVYGGRSPGCDRAIVRRTRGTSPTSRALEPS